MNTSDSSVRTYRSDLRRRQAAQTRLRVVEAAARLFAGQGYRATTFAQLAGEAGVSVKTVQEHGPKSALLRAAVELTAFGVEGETDFFATDLGRALLSVREPNALAGMIADAMLAINAPTAGLWITVVGAAPGDDDLSAFQAGMLELIRGQVGHVLRYMDEQGWLRADVPFDELVGACCVITSVESYVRFVVQDGRTPEQYQAFVARTVRETIFAR